MALEDEYGSCAADDQNFNMTHIALYGLHGVILVLELVVGLGLIAVGCILYRKHLAPVPFAVPSAGSRQLRSSSADGSLSTHDHRPSEGTAHSEGHRHLAASSFSTPVTIACLNHVTSTVDTPGYNIATLFDTVLQY